MSGSHVRCPSRQATLGDSLLLALLNRSDHELFRSWRELTRMRIDIHIHDTLELHFSQVIDPSSHVRTILELENAVEKPATVSLASCVSVEFRVELHHSSEFVACLQCCIVSRNCQLCRCAIVSSIVSRLCGLSVLYLALCIRKLIHKTPKLFWHSISSAVEQQRQTGNTHFQNTSLMRRLLLGELIVEMP